MDPITAIGFAANILQFIDCGAKVVTGAIEIYGSASGSTQETRNSEMIVAEMRLFAAKLQPPENAQLSGEERALCKLATECQGLAKQIFDLLEKIKPKSQKSKGSSLIASLKTKMYEGERRKLELQLSNFRAQLNLQLNHVMSSETRARLNALVASVKDDSTKLDNLQDQLEQLRRGVACEYLTAGARTKLQSLLGMSEHASDVIVQHRILESLAFNGMYGRYETVDDAHFRTLGWIFNSNLDDSQNEDEIESLWSSEDDLDNDQQEDETKNVPNLEEKSNDSRSGDEVEAIPSSAEGLDNGQPEDEVESVSSIEDDAKASARESLLSWLSSGAGIFHISGKLGSGKSTLMKYLCEHDSTRYLLKHWAGRKVLVFASFFFWKPGSTLQKSLTGLIRSLLHDILKACPELIQETLPDYWAQIKSTPWQVGRELPLSDKSIRQAFLRLVSDRKLYRDHCFCFFIDGLDEYEGTNQEDAKTLVDLICSWTKLAPETIKICVSSREHNVFMNAFSTDLRIRLHDLTRSDMTHYVLDKLQHMNRDEDRLIITQAIVENAQGIFVWVALVVRRIREQIENGANLNTLEREIYSLPKELNDLFEHILNSLVDSDLKVAYQTFSMVFGLNKNMSKFSLRLTLLSYSFLDDYMDDPTFASRKGCQRRFMDREETALRIESARRRLNGCCRGLLEVRRDEDDDDETIVITHRSVPEFMLIRAQKDQMERYLNGFNVVDAISELTLAELWSRNPGQINREGNFDRLAMLLVPWRISDRLDKPPYSFRESLALAWQRHQVEGNYDDQGAILWILAEDGSNSVDVILNINNGGRHLRHPIYSAAFHGDYDFVQWELGRNSAPIPLLTPLRLLNCIIAHPEVQKPQVLGDMLDCLQSHGLRPQTASSLFLLSLNPLTVNRQGILGDKNTVVTVWHHILLSCYKHEISSNFMGLRGMRYVVEKFLEYGADPYFYISVAKFDDWRMKLVVRVGKERHEQWLASTFHPNAVLYECDNLSLIDLIERWGFENKARILQLIEKNTLMLEGAGEARITPLPAEEQSAENPSSTSEMVDSGAGMGFVMARIGLVSGDPEIPMASGLKRYVLAGLAGFGSQKLLSIGTGISVSILILGECHSSIPLSLQANIARALWLLY